MTITTDYDIDDQVWYMHNNEPKQDTVLSIGISVGEGTTITYIFAENIIKTENLVFSTKQNLLNSFLET